MRKMIKDLENQNKQLNKTSTEIEGKFKKNLTILKCYEEKVNQILNDKEKDKVKKKQKRREAKTIKTILPKKEKELKVKSNYKAKSRTFVSKRVGESALILNKNPNKIKDVQNSARLFSSQNHKIISLSQPKEESETEAKPLPIDIQMTKHNFKSIEKKKETLMGIKQLKGEIDEIKSSLKLMKVTDIKGAVENKKQILKNDIEKGLDKYQSEHHKKAMKRKTELLYREKLRKAYEDSSDEEDQFLVDRIKRLHRERMAKLGGTKTGKGTSLILKEQTMSKIEKRLLEKNKRENAKDGMCLKAQPKNSSKGLSRNRVNTCSPSPDYSLTMTPNISKQKKCTNQYSSDAVPKHFMSGSKALSIIQKRNETMSIEESNSYIPEMELKDSNSSEHQSYSALSNTFDALSFLELEKMKSLLEEKIKRKQLPESRIKHKAYQEQEVLSSSNNQMNSLSSDDEIIQLDDELYDDNFLSIIDEVEKDQSALQEKSSDFNDLD